MPIRIKWINATESQKEKIVQQFYKYGGYGTKPWDPEIANIFVWTIDD